MLSARSFEPLLCVWVASPVHPDGRNACPELTLSPPTAPMKNVAVAPAACDREIDVDAAS